MNNPDIKSTRFFSLYTTVQGRVYAYLLMVLHNRVAAEDVLQETAAVMWEKFDRFKEGEHFGAWAISIARNKALEYLRQNKKTKMLFSDQCYLDISEVAASSSGDFISRLSALDGCIKKLDKEQRHLLGMRYKNKVPIKEISQLSGSSSRLLYLKLVRIFDVLRICIQNTLARQDI